MASKRAQANYFYFILSGTLSLSTHLNVPVVVNQNYSGNGTSFEEVRKLDEWLLHGFECCSNIVETNHTESAELQELNRVPDIIYSGNLEEIQDLMAGINKNTELVIANSVNPYISVAYTCTALLLFVIGFLIQKLRRENSPTFQENEYSGKTF